MKLGRSSVLIVVFPLLTGANTITSGTITTTGGGILIGNFNFSGPGFSASGGFGNVAPNCNLANAHPTGTPPGGAVGVNCVTAGDDFFAGAATVDGMVFNNVQWGGINSSSIFNIVGGPPITLNAGPGDYQTTFTLSGQLCGGGRSFILPTAPR